VGVCNVAGRGVDLSLFFVRGGWVWWCSLFQVVYLGGVFVVIWWFALCFFICCGLFVVAHRFFLIVQLFCFYNLSGPSFFDRLALLWVWC